MIKKITICLQLLLYPTIGLSQEKIILYTFYTPSHEILLREWFLPSIQDDFEVVVKLFDQTCPSGTYMETGWITTMLYKVDLIIDAINEHWGNIIFYADVDVQFFKPTADHIHKALQVSDLVIQRASPKDKVCAGLFALRANDHTLKLFKQVKNRIKLRKESDNPALDAILHWPYCGVKWDYLPISFFSTGGLSSKTFSQKNCWQEGDSVIIPDELILHHANYTKGVDNKIKLLEYVKSLIREKTIKKKQN